MVDVNKWGTKLEDNYTKINEQNERRQEMLDMMKEVADGFIKSQSKDRLDTLANSFLNGTLDADGFRDAYTDYYAEYEADDDDDSGLAYL